MYLYMHKVFNYKESFGNAQSFQIMEIVIEEEAVLPPVL